MSIRIGTEDWARICRHTTYPSVSGSPKSNRITSGEGAAARRAPVVTLLTSNPCPDQPLRQRRRDPVVVFDQQDAEAARMCPRARGWHQIIHAGPGGLVVGGGKYCST